MEQNSKIPVWDIPVSLLATFLFFRCHLNHCVRVLESEWLTNEAALAQHRDCKFHSLSTLKWLVTLGTVFSPYLNFLICKMRIVITLYLMVYWGWQRNCKVICKHRKYMNYALFEWQCGSKAPTEMEFFHLVSVPCYWQSRQSHLAAE